MIRKYLFSINTLLIIALISTIFIVILPSFKGLLNNQSVVVKQGQKHQKTVVSKSNNKNSTNIPTPSAPTYLRKIQITNVGYGEYQTVVATPTAMLQNLDTRETAQNVYVTFLIYNSNNTLINTLKSNPFNLAPNGMTPVSELCIRGCLGISSVQAIVTVGDWMPGGSSATATGSMSFQCTSCYKGEPAGDMNIVQNFTNIPHDATVLQAFSLCTNAQNVIVAGGNESIPTLGSTTITASVPTIFREPVAKCVVMVNG